MSSWATLHDDNAVQCPPEKWIFFLLPSKNHKTWISRSYQFYTSLVCGLFTVNNHHSIFLLEELRFLFAVMPPNFNKKREREIERERESVALVPLSVACWPLFSFVYCKFCTQTLVDIFRAPDFCHLMWMFCFDISFFLLSSRYVCSLRCSMFVIFLFACKSKSHPAWNRFASSHTCLPWIISKFRYHRNSTQWFVLKCLDEYGYTQILLCFPNVPYSVPFCLFRSPNTCSFIKMCVMKEYLRFMPT